MDGEKKKDEAITPVLIIVMVCHASTGEIHRLPHAFSCRAHLAVENPR